MYTHEPGLRIHKDGKYQFSLANEFGGFSVGNSYADLYEMVDRLVFLLNTAGGVLKAIRFQCENCRLYVEADVEDGEVSCPNCEHTVNVGVYVDADGNS